MNVAFYRIYRVESAILLVTWSWVLRGPTELTGTAEEFHRRKHAVPRGDSFETNAILGGAGQFGRIQLNDSFHRRTVDIIALEGALVLGADGLGGTLQILVAGNHRKDRPLSSALPASPPGTPSGTPR